MKKDNCEKESKKKEESKPMTRGERMAYMADEMKKAPKKKGK